MSVDRPVTFRDVFAVSEYRAVYLALIASWIGDYLARAAVTVLVFQRTDSVLLSAAAFATSYLPWLLFGPLLAALAERHSYRSAMVLGDLARTALILILVIPGVPWPAILAVLFAVTLAGVPIQAARSALMPLMLGRSRMAVAMAANATTIQAAQVAGYLVGATVAAAANPRLAMGIVALLFVTSALLVAGGVRHRPPAVPEGQRTHLVKESAEGFRLVFGSRMLRSIALLAFSISAFSIVPEGLAAAWAAQSDPGSVSRGLGQGMIMAAGPVGFVIGGLITGRLITQATRHRLIRPLAVLAPLMLIPAVTSPPVPIVVVLTLLSGAAMGGLIPTLNTQFVLCLPHGYRARAFGVMQQGLQVAQGGAVLLTGVLADHAPVPVVVGLWSVAGAGLMLAQAYRWPGAGSQVETAAEPPAPARPRLREAAGTIDG
ncbi:MFS transporter [Actinoplanes sp. NPDC051470]|uniref:MFS transporter n=1 Tax=unclassified Actinoplanes TaxID=2626549 RepID=UPI00344078AC